MVVDLDIIGRTGSESFEKHQKLRMLLPALAIQGKMVTWSISVCS